MCFQIKKMKENIRYDVDGELNTLRIGFDKLDLSLNYQSDKQFRMWVNEVYFVAAADISQELGKLCEKRLSRFSVEQLLSWTLEEQKAWLFYGVTDHLYGMVGTRNMTEPRYIRIVMNCFIALGSYQKALDFVFHWRRIEPLKIKRKLDGMLINHYKKWTDGNYEKQNMAKDFDFLVRTEESGEEELNISYNLVIIKLYLIAVMSDHLAKRERFLAFMLGTHPRLGCNSNVMRIACLSPAVRLLAKYCGISSNPLGIPSSNISDISLAQNKSYLESLLRKVQSLNPHAIFSLIGDYSLRKLDFQSEEGFMSKHAVRASWSAGTWTRVILDKLQNSEKEMFIEMARKVINQPPGNVLSADYGAVQKTCDSVLAHLRLPPPPFDSL